MFHIPSLRVASYVILQGTYFIFSSSFPYHNFLSYAMGQMRVYRFFCIVLVTIRYPSIIKYAKENGIEDTSVILESYAMDKPIIYNMALEHTELFNTLRSMKATSAASVLNRND